MKITRDGKIERDDIWREGKYIDLWSVVHLLTGVSFGLGMFFLKFGTAPSALIVFILLVAYELWEALVKIEETPQNRMMDVVLGMTSFIPTFFYLAPLLPQTDLIIPFASILAANVILAALGWFESKKASALEAKMRTEYELNRARMLARRDKLRARLEAGRKRRAERRNP